MHKALESHGRPPDLKETFLVDEADNAKLIKRSFFFSSVDAKARKRRRRHGLGHDRIYTANTIDYRQDESRLEILGHVIRL